MTLRDDLEHLVRSEVTADTTPHADELAARGMDRDVADALSGLNAYCNALKDALLVVADELDALRAV